MTKQENDTNREGIEKRLPERDILCSSSEIICFKVLCIGVSSEFEETVEVLKGMLSRWLKKRCEQAFHLSMDFTGAKS